MFVFWFFVWGWKGGMGVGAGLEGTVRRGRGVVGEDELLFR